MKLFYVSTAILMALVNLSSASTAITSFDHSCHWQFQKGKYSNPDVFSCLSSRRLGKTKSKSKNSSKNGPIVRFYKERGVISDERGDYCLHHDKFSNKIIMKECQFTQQQWGIIPLAGDIILFENYSTASCIERAPSTGAMFANHCNEHNAYQFFKEPNEDFYIFH